MTRDKKIFNIAMNKLKNLTNDEWAVMKKRYAEDKTNYNVPDGVELLYPHINSRKTLLIAKKTADYVMQHFLQIDRDGILHIRNVFYPVEIYGSTNDFTIELSADKDKGVRLVLIDWNSEEDICEIYARTKDEFYDNVAKMVCRYYEYQELSAERNH